jgi:hypothetical protein
LLPERYRHPEFGRWTRESSWRREARVRFLSMLCGLSVASAAAGVLGARHSASVPDSPIASRAAGVASVSAKAPADVADHRALADTAGRNTARANIGADHARAAVNAAPTIDVGAACGSSGAACRDGTRPLGKPRAARIPAANDRPTIAGVLVGRAGPSSAGGEGSWTDVPNQPTASPSSKRTSEQAPAVTLEPSAAPAERSNAGRLLHRRSTIARTQRRDASSHYRAAVRENSSVRTVAPNRSYERANSANRNRFWAWSW